MRTGPGHEVALEIIGVYFNESWQHIVTTHVYGTCHRCTTGVYVLNSTVLDVDAAVHHFVCQHDTCVGQGNCVAHTALRN